MTSRAYVVDLIQLIGEKTALTSHLEEHSIDGMDASGTCRGSQFKAKTNAGLNGFIGQSEPEMRDFKHAVKSFTLDSEVYEGRTDRSRFRKS